MNLMRAIFIVLVLIISLFCCNCAKDGEVVKKDDYYVESDFNNRYRFCEDVVLVVEGTFRLEALPDSFNVIITNASENAYMRLGSPILERMIDDTWYTFSLQGTNDIGYYLDRFQCAEIKIGIECYREYITVGLYRIIGLISQASSEYDYSGTTYMIGCEFYIEA